MRKKSRLFAIAEALRARRTGVTAQQLADRFGVTLRTIYRDLESLQDAGMRPNDESVVMQNTDLRADDPSFQAAVRQGVADLKGTEYVTDVASPYA